MTDVNAVGRPHYFGGRVDRSGQAGNSTKPPYRV